MDGPRRVIPEYRRPDKYKNLTTALSFHLRPNFNPDAVARRRDQVFEQLMTKWNYTFGFMSADEDPRGPHIDFETGKPGCYGVTIPNDEQMAFDKESFPEWGIWTYLVYQYPEFLLRDGLNDADRMSMEWLIASTVFYILGKPLENVLMRG